MEEDDLPFSIFFGNSIHYLFVHLMCVNNMTIKVCCIDDIVISRCVFGERKMRQAIIMAMVLTPFKNF